MISIVILHVFLSGSMYLCTPRAYLVLRVQKSILKLLELELQTAVCHHVGARTKCQFPLEKQPVLLTYEPSVQPHFLFELYLVCVWGGGVRARACLTHAVCMHMDVKE